MVVNTKRVEEVKAIVRDRHTHNQLSMIETLGEVLSELPAFQTPEWIKCSERMPARQTPIYFRAYGNVYAGFLRTISSKAVEFVGCSHCEMVNPSRNDVDGWMPRQVPVLPAEEESEQLAKLRAFLAIKPNRFPASDENIIQIIKEFEKAGEEMSDEKPPILESRHDVIEALNDQIINKHYRLIESALWRCAWLDEGAEHFRWHHPTMENPHSKKPDHAAGKIAYSRAEAWLEWVKQK